MCTAAVLVLGVGESIFKTVCTSSEQFTTWYFSCLWVVFVVSYTVPGVTPDARVRSMI